MKSFFSTTNFLSPLTNQTTFSRRQNFSFTNFLSSTNFSFTNFLSPTNFSFTNFSRRQTFPAPTSLVDKKLFTQRKVIEPNPIMTRKYLQDHPCLVRVNGQEEGFERPNGNTTL